MTTEVGSQQSAWAVPIRAPAKAMIVGEYAVLDGSPAVVAAIDCFASATLQTEAGSAASPFILAAQEQARTALQARGIDAAQAHLDRLPLVDTSSFSRDGRKLGLGSSASATVAAVGCWYAAAGLDLESSAVRREIAQVARQAHDIAQGVRGSGADILAATWGGLRIVGADQTDRPDSLSLPPGLCLRLVATTESASTSALVARYRAAADATLPARHQLANAARTFIAACQRSDAAQALHALNDALDGYAQLGHAIGCPLVTDEHAAIAAVARALGGAAKPSGAGGGDLAVALLPSEDAALSLQLRLPSGLAVLPLQVSEQGIHKALSAVAG